MLAWMEGFEAVRPNAFHSLLWVELSNLRYRLAPITPYPRLPRVLSPHRGDTSCGRGLRALRSYSQCPGAGSPTGDSLGSGIGQPPATNHLTTSPGPTATRHRLLRLHGEQAAVIGPRLRTWLPLFFSPFLLYNGTI